MLFNPWVTFGAGLLVGGLGPRLLLGQPQGRKAVKTVIRGGLAAYDWVAAQIETAREDIVDLAAEARQEAADGGPATSGQPAPAASGQAGAAGERPGNPATGEPAGSV